MSKGKTTKKVKDPNAPKRNRTAYILFTIEKRQHVKTENPGLAPKEIISELGALWKSADPQTKQYFQKLADAEKAEYQTKSNAHKNEKISKSTKNDQSINGDNNQSMETNSA